MDTPQLTRDEVVARVTASPASKVKVAITDVDGVLRGKYLHKQKLLGALDGGFGFCSVVFGWDAGDACYDNATYTGWHTGYPDAMVRLDPATYREVPWDGGVPFLLGEFISDKGTPLAICPRQTLRRVLARARQAGLEPQSSLEYEWFNFRETPHTLAERGFHEPRPLTPGMFGYSIVRMSQNAPFVNALFDELAAFRVPLEGLHTETGPGVFEAALVYGDPLESADRAILFKTGAKEIASRFGIMPTFMAKWDAALPGCSGHLHQSLWDAGKTRNLFHDPNGLHGMSALLRRYLAGQLRLMPELLPLYAPTVNSYKRLVEGAWAPTRVNWGVDNRTTAVRVIPGSPKSTRLETRVTGSDANPYLASAAAIASGLWGIEQGLELDQAPVTANGYADTRSPRLPQTLAEATERFRRSEVARELLGDEFVEHFAATREWETRQFQQAVTSWELARYFETI